MEEQQSLISLEELTEQDLLYAGIQDCSTGMRFVRELAGQGVADDDLAPLIPLLLEALKQSPDADRALIGFVHWFDAVGSRYTYLQFLIKNPNTLNLICLVMGCSQYFADLLARQPEYFEIFANPGMQGGLKTSASLLREVRDLLNACQQPELKRDVLRRWKALQMLRIGVRDLGGLADMPLTAREFSNLADACVQVACEIAYYMLPTSDFTTSSTPNSVFPLPFMVLAMGKLGGQELNYSSDIDLVFIHADNLPERITLENSRSLETTGYLLRIAESVVKILTEDSANGHVFRVDMRLRPEGRFGALSRSLSSCRAYYESWAENWERQALLKVRCIAGDRVLGESFLEMIEPFIYRKQVSMTFLEDIRANKRRIEEKCAFDGETFTNVKTGYGGIRDVEFIVQMKQLEFGGVWPRLRTPNTLHALQRLRHHGFLSASSSQELSDDYQFMRTLEHRLQLLHGFQTQILPAETHISELTKVARRMGFGKLEYFRQELQKRRERLRHYLENLFYNSSSTNETLHIYRSLEMSDIEQLLLNIDSAIARDQLSKILSNLGFKDITAALNALQLPMKGNEFGGMPPDTPVKFLKIARTLLEQLAHSASPDDGLAGIETMATAVPNRAQLYAAFDESPELLRKMVLLASSAPSLFQQLCRHQEWMEYLFSEAEEEEPSAESPALSIEPIQPPNPYNEFYEKRMKGSKTHADRLAVTAKIYQREFLKIGARDVWGELNTRGVMRNITLLAEATLNILMDICKTDIAGRHSEPELARSALDQVAVVGLGKLGGAELGYSSDWDVVFAFEPFSESAAIKSEVVFDLVNELVQKMLAVGTELEPLGVRIEIDLRLRPWGKKGALIQTIESFTDYYRTDAETWERQAALKARFVAGNSKVGRNFETVLQAVSFARGVTSVEVETIRDMKKRIEKERLNPRSLYTNLKLGYGGLSDIEWLVQILQLRLGPYLKSVNIPGTLRALTAIASVQALDIAESDTLQSAYRTLTHIRNSIWLTTGTSRDELPEDTARLRILARQLGYTESFGQSAESQLASDVTSTMAEVRQIFQNRFK